MPRPEWNDRYATGDLPWDTGRPDENLVALVTSGQITPGHTLEIGCGTGTNALWLAEQGFDVLGIDLSPLAIDKARAKLAGTKLACRFETTDFLASDVPGAPFDVVFDRGCFHIFDDAAEQARFAERIARVLSPHGQWVSLIGSTEGDPRDHGPPRRSAREIVGAIEPVLELAELRSALFRADTPTPACAWLCIARHRHVPAQPSTRY